MSEKWLKISEHLRTVLLLAFALPVMALYFDWFKDSDFFTIRRLNNIKNLAILLYIIVYVVELRMKLKQQALEIEKLKTKLLRYEK
jgi:Ca2+/H+ antiporter